MCYINECYLVETGYTYRVNDNKIFNRNIFIPFPLLNSFVNQHNESGVFCTAYKYNSQDIDNSYLYGDLYFDFDDVDNFENVRKDALMTLSFLEIKFKIKQDQLKIFYSGNKGIHIIVPATLLKVEPHLKLNLIYKTIASDLYEFLQYKTLDLKIYDNKRLFRIPNTKHEKSGLYKIQLTSEELNSLPCEDIKRMATSKRDLHLEVSMATSNLIAEQRYLLYIGKYFQEVESLELKAKQRFNRKFSFVPPCIDHLINHGAEVGMRNHSIAILAGFYKMYGKNLNETIDIIEEWNSNNSNPTNSNEMTKTIKSIFSSDKCFGCSTLKQMGLCEESCKIYKKEKK